MIKKLNLIYLGNLTKLKAWAYENILGLFIYNLSLILLLLLRSAGYFTPFFPLDVNIVFFISLILAVLLLKIRSKTVFGIAISFWLFAAFLRIVKVYFWAERSAIYAFEALMVGLIILILEELFSNFKSERKHVSS